MSSLKGIRNRIISDFFLRNRIAKYDLLLQKAINSGYEIMSHSAYFERVKKGLSLDSKILIIRQDIDSDPKFALKWLAVQKKHNVHSSMYFRKCTFDKAVMQKVQESGCDCGYHYEEIADFAKEKKLRYPQVVLTHLEEIQTLFKANLRQMETAVGFKIKHVASHGDFANRILNLPNHLLMTPKLLEECQLDFEAYQKEFTETYSINISDCGYPTFYKTKLTPEQAIDLQTPIIHLLLHPKHWRCSWKWNIYENFKRVKEGFSYR